MSKNKVHLAKFLNRHSSKSIWLIQLSFGQNDPLMGQSFWPKYSLITHMLFKLCLFRHLAQCTLFLLTLYFFHSNSHVIGNESIPFWSLKFVTPGHNSLSEKLSRFEPFHSFHQLPLRPRICMKYFLSFPQKNKQQRKLRQTR